MFKKNLHEIRVGRIPTGEAALGADAEQFQGAIEPAQDLGGLQLKELVEVELVYSAQPAED